MPAPRSRRPAALLALALALPLAGCGGFRVRDESMGARCGDLMSEAFPGADIKITKTTVSTAPQASVATTVIEVEGQRRGTLASVVRRDLAVECRFDDGILTGFRWTAGPVR